MLSNSFLPKSRSSVTRVLYGRTTTSNRSWETIDVPKWASFASILLIGAGGNGGTGVIGANSNAAGGGGGGSGGQTYIPILPVSMLPTTWYFQGGGAGIGSAPTGIVSSLTFLPITSIPPQVNHTLALANNGTNGGNASGATAGSLGAAGAVVATANMVAARASAFYLAGQAGLIGATTGNNTAITIPTTGLIVTGGQGGAGLPATATVGSNSLAWTTPTTTPAYNLLFPSVPQLTGPAAATTPAPSGKQGSVVYWGDTYVPSFMYGGQGGTSTHGSATTTGLVQASGGDGAPGCGGGGSGGALTGSTAGVPGKGGAGLCVIIFW